MDPIDDRFLFSHPEVLSSSRNSQVILLKSRLPRGQPFDSIVKCFPSRARVEYEKEISVYTVLTENDVSFKYAKPIGYGQWSSQKYVKILGKKHSSLLDEGSDDIISVLMLEFLEEAVPLSDSTNIIAQEPDSGLFIATSALSSLAKLHSLGIVHGDISTSNVLLCESDSLWIDFSSSWINAPSNQIAWEWDRAVEYFSLWVNHRSNPAKK